MFPFDSTVLLWCVDAGSLAKDTVFLEERRENHELRTIVCSYFLNNFRELSFTHGEKLL